MRIATETLDNEQQHLWRQLYDRSVSGWKEVSPSEEFFNKFRIHMSSTPRLSDIVIPNFRIFPVYGKLDNDDFFRLLANRTFPVNARLRDPDNQNYLAERDLWHDNCHIPFLYSREMQNFLTNLGLLWEYSKNEWAKGKIRRQAIERAYWATAEFGLTYNDGVFAVLGAGIMSSPDELDIAISEIHKYVNPDESRVREFNLVDVANWDYPTEGFQDRYYWIRVGQFDSIIKSLWAL